MQWKHCMSICKFFLFFYQIGDLMSGVTNTFQMLLDAFTDLSTKLSTLHSDLVDLHGHLEAIQNQTDKLEFEAITNYLEVKTH